MEPQQPSQQVTVNLASSKPPLWAELLVLLVTLAGTAGMVWMSLPPQEREWLRLAMRERARSFGRSLGVRAWRAGHAGMGEELAGRDPSPFYKSAAMLARWARKLEQQR